MTTPSQARKAPDRPATFRTAAGRGLVDPACAGALRHLLEAGDPLVWERAFEGLREVKASTVRRTLEGEIAGIPVHVKLYRATRLSDRARDALGGSRGEREFDNLHRARARGLPAVRPILAGVYSGSFGARSFLLTGTATGKRSLPPDLGSEEDNRAAGRLLRRAHDAGLEVPDLHPGNVLAGGGEAMLVDLTHARWSSVVELRARARGLAFFCQGLDGGLDDPRAAALWESYAQPRLEAADELRAAALRAGRRIRHRALVAFGRRAFRPCRHTATPARGKGQARWFLFRSGDSERDSRRAAELAALEPRLDELPYRRAGRRGRVILTDDYAIKTRQPGAAKRLWQAAYWLLFAGAPGPRPVALSLRPEGGAVWFERLPGSDLAAELPALQPAEIVAAASALGRSLGRLHAFGLRNRDLKLDNLVYHRQTGEVHMVDLDGLRQKLPLDRRGQAADLGRLLAAFEEAGEPGGGQTWRAFLRAYLRARRALQCPVAGRFLYRQAAHRARQWAAAHA